MQSETKICVGSHVFVKLQSQDLRFREREMLERYAGAEGEVDSRSSSLVRLLP